MSNRMKINYLIIVLKKKLFHKVFLKYQKKHDVTFKVNTF